MLHGVEGGEGGLQHEGVRADAQDGGGVEEVGVPGVGHISARNSASSSKKRAQTAHGAMKYRVFVCALSGPSIWFSERQVLKT